MTATFIPQDEAARQRIRDSLDESLFVEAGAGTGKTTSLVDRVMTLAIFGRTTLDQIAVITFTDAAAAELRDRVRERLERTASAADLTDDERGRAQRALGDLDRSSIQTLHSFARAILGERPLEAGLPPAFETMDAIQSELAFEEAWAEWVDWALEAPELRPDLELAFSLGLTPGHLREVALTFHQNYDMLAEVSFADVPLPTVTAISELVGGAAELARLCQFSKIGDGDKLYDHVQVLLRAINRFGELEPGSPPAYRLLQRTLPVKQSGGRQGDWGTDPETSANACKRLKDWLSDIDEKAGQELASLRQAAIARILRPLQRFALDSAAERKRDGRAGFHDLLVWARDLLRDDIGVRDHFRSRFTHILIDEAQDTDPIQAEIAMFIAEGRAGEGGTDLPDDARARLWLNVTPEPGKLFVVGDPKQSIYRFRRADVTQMNTLRGLMGGATLHLVQNFRSQQPVLEWVNCVFEPWMAEGFEQADYVPVAPRWGAATDHPAKPRVWWMGGPIDERIEAIRREESEAIAALLHTIAGGHWQVLDQAATAESGFERYRNATFSDVCILMPRRTGLRALELAIDEAGIPFRLEGASLIFDTQEVRDLINCLEAIDDPADQVALVAALRSPAFACSDVDLLRFSEAGGKFDYLSDSLSEWTDGDSPVVNALGVLRDFHERRMWVSVALLIDSFIRRRLLMEAAIDHPRTREQWRRYRFMVERARAFAEAGGNSLRAFLEWINRQAAEGARVNETPAPESDEEAVRIMTVHGAKGLEFPVVILTALNSEPRADAPVVLFDRDSRSAEVRVGLAQSRFETAGYESLLEREKRLEEDEATRLLYVAATRARDHLVLSMYRSDARGERTAAGHIAGILEGKDGLWEPVPAAYVQAPLPGPGDGNGDSLDGHSLAERDEWDRHRRDLLQRQGRPVSVAATGLANVLKEEPQTDEPWKRGRGGTALGRAVHSVLQTIDLATGHGIDETSRAQATAEGIPHRWEEVARLARVAVDSAVVRRATKSRYWREAPVAIPVADGVLEGFIDLMFEEHGGLVLVDYKTDSVDEEGVDAAMARYRMQGGAYALAVQRATGRTVTEVVFLFLQPDRTESLTDIDVLTAEAESAAMEYLSAAKVGPGEGQG